MKKFALLLLSLTLCFALAACGGSDTSADEQAAADDTAASTTADESADTSATSDKQTAIDEFNATSAAFNEVANAINADPSAFDSDVIDTMQQMSDLLNQYQQMLSGDDEYTQEDLDKMTEWADEFHQQYPNLTMEVIGTSWDDHNTKLSTMAQAGEAPDIAEIAYAALATYVENGTALNLSECMDKDQLADSAYAKLVNPFCQFH